MDINRHNYEEFFLMFVDGELNSQQQQIVQNFVANNPDLQQDLNMLLDTKLIADDLIFDKSNLYKNELTAINSNNYEEKFLLYIDNELALTEKENVETFVLQNPTVQSSFTLLKSTLLQKENIVCPNKEALYKKEERPIVFMWVKRLSVAAAIVLFAVMAWMLIPNRNNKLSPISSVANNNKKVEKSIEPTVTLKYVKPLHNQVVVVKNIPIKKQNPNTKQINEPSYFVKNSNNQQQDNNKINAIIVKQNQEKTPINIIQTQQPNNTIAVVNTTITNEAKGILPDKKNEVAVVSTASKQNESNIVQPAIYRMLNTEDDVTDNTVLVGNLKVNKTKLSNLFKKAKGIFSKPKAEVDAKNTYASNSNTL